MATFGGTAHPVRDWSRWTSIVDAIGAGLLLLLGAWTVRAGVSNPGSRPGPVLALLAGSAAAFCTGRCIAGRLALGPTGIVAIAVAGALALAAPGFGQAGGEPLGYANANAALAALGVLAAFGACADSGRRGRVPWAALGTAMGAAMLLMGSVLAAGALGVSSLLLVGGILSRKPSATVLGGAITVVLALGVTLAIARGAGLAGLADLAAERGPLWTAAADLASDNQGTGVGPGRFAAVSRASSDADLRWAHNGYLQVAAELGVVGLVMLVSLLGWVYARLALAASVARPQPAALGAAAVTMVALHATGDYVLHFPAVVLTLAVLVGAATAQRPHPDPRT